MGEATFNLKENPWPLDFINKENLKTFGLGLVEKPQATPTATLLAIVAPPVASNALYAKTAPISGFSNALYATTAPIGGFRATI